MGERTEREGWWILLGATGVLVAALAIIAFFIDFSAFMRFTLLAGTICAGGFFFWHKVIEIHEREQAKPPVQRQSEFKSDLDRRLADRLKKDD